MKTILCFEKCVQIDYLGRLITRGYGPATEEERERWRKIYALKLSSRIASEATAKALP